MRILINEFKRRPLFVLLFLPVIYAVIYTFFIYSSPLTDSLNKESVSFVGKIIEKTVSEDGSTESITLKDGINVICYTDTLGISPDRLPIGSTVCISGKTTVYKKATNPGEFDSFAYHETNREYFYISANSINMIETPRILLKEYLFRLKRFFVNRVSEYCPLEGGTINTLLFGDKSRLDPERKNLYGSAGIAHFLVISGLHMSVAGGGIYEALKSIGIKRRLAAVFSILFILFYGLLTGYTVSVTRAVIMFFIRLVAEIIDRAYDLLTALLISASISLLTNPLQIRSSSFIYSYSCVLFIGFFFAYADKSLRKTYMVPIITYLGLLPITLKLQGFSSLLSILVNIVLSIFTLPVLLFSLMAFIFSLLKISFLASLFDFFTALILRGMDKVSLLSGINAFRITYSPKNLQIFIYYVVFFLLIILSVRRIRIIKSLFYIISAITLCMNNPNPFPLLTVLDVGQGECIIVKYQKREAIILDCGSKSKADIGNNIVLPYLYSNGITRISDIILSHSDIDHVNGVNALLTDNNLDINRIVFSGGESEKNNDSFKEIYNEAFKRNIVCSSINIGDTINHGNLFLYCLWPDNSTFDDINSGSVVLWGQISKDTFLFSGDITGESEEVISFPRADIYICAHHGSRYSSNTDTLQSIRPKISVISCGLNNKYGHPHEETLNRLKKVGSEIIRTDQNGAITLIFCKRKIIIN